MDSEQERTVSDMETSVGSKTVMSDLTTTSENAEPETVSEHAEPLTVSENAEPLTVSEKAEREPASRSNVHNKKRRVSDDQNQERGDKKPKMEDKTSILIQKQIEYYLSDMNMKRDKFFHAKISENPEGWLDMKHILSCKKIQSLSATQETILAALAGSYLETKVDGNDVGWVRRTTPLPDLEPGSFGGARPGRHNRHDDHKNHNQNNHHNKNDRKSKSSPKFPTDIHTYGCLVRVTGIPEEFSWVKVKEAMISSLQNATGDSNADGKVIHHVRFVAPVNADGETFIYCRPFQNDVDILKKTERLEAGGAELAVSLVTDVEVAGLFFETQLPPPLKKDRDREHMRFMSEKMTRAVEVGGTRFESIEHLKKCYKELLQKTPEDTELGPTAYNVIRALLDYHPNGAEKAKDVVAIRVKEHADYTPRVKGFFLVRSDGTSEDFSMVKIMEVLIRNPPFVDRMKEKRLEKKDVESSNTEQKPDGVNEDNDDAGDASGC